MHFFSFLLCLFVFLFWANTMSPCWRLMHAIELSLVVLLWCVFFTSLFLLSSIQLVLVLKSLLDDSTNNMPHNEQIRLRLTVILVFATLSYAPFTSCMSKYKFAVFFPCPTPLPLLGLLCIVMSYGTLIETY